MQVNSKKRKNCFALIIGNRGFFPGALCQEGREQMLRVLDEEGFDVVCLSPEQTKFGSVESLQDARICGELFQQHAGDIDGIIVSLPNFGDERNAANAIRFSGIQVPVLVQAFPDAANRMLMGNRRDSFCGKISVCNNLWQYGIKYSLTSRHTVEPNSPGFRADLQSFAATCRVVKGLKQVRVGVIGARPASFNTVRFSEKLMENAGISVETLDLSEVLGRVDRLKDDAPETQGKLAAIARYVSTQGIPAASLMKMAKFGVVVDQWMEANDLAGSSVQCWTSMQEFFGVMPCTLMSLMSENLLPSACETDMIGMVGMYILQLAAQSPSAIVDWNNNFGDDPDKAVIFHCSNLPKHFFQDVRMDFNEIIGSVAGKDNSFGTVVGRLRSGPVTFCRVSTDDLHGRIRAYIGEGELTSDPIESFGGYGVLRVPDLQNLMEYICKNGYEHHVAVNLSINARAIREALGTYKGWDVHRHGGLAGCN
ncbi:MAG: L-fucose/L-arabinose isomerase family protein [Methanoregula sp.]